ncbi:UNVERIFIED_CONTAM: hypothetical protein FKN15_044598 [Acipenser sinensis]
MENPAQPDLKKFPSRSYGDKKRSFNLAWYNNREWLEYSIKSDSYFCFPCRESGSLTGNADLAFTVSRYCDWKHAIESNKGLNKHALSKGYLHCMAAWNERKVRGTLGKAVSTLVNSGQLERNQYYMAAIIDMIEFLAVHELPFRGSDKSVDTCG